MGDANDSAQHIVFFHPDLGIGGAERLIVDAAVGLQGLGHKVTIFTSHCDPNHCFDEARDGTLDVRVRGHTLFPPTFLNRFHILLAILRQIHLVLSVSLFTSELRTLRPDIFVVDQLSACVPLLRWMWPDDQSILFYCHFPDQLLARRDEKGVLGLIKQVYRYPFDWFEGWSMSGSDKVVVNSNFTKGVVNSLFTGLGELGVIYPCVDTAAISTEGGIETKPLWPNKSVLLSINRFERKKDIALAIHAYHGLAPSVRQSIRLVLAGGYDSRVAENVAYHQELVELAESLQLNTATAKTAPTALAIPVSVDVLFLLSVPGAFKTTLLQHAKLLIYTPANEHFGIVPVEAMQYGVPVLACNSGGPLETVVEARTGWLRDPGRVAEWTAVLHTVVTELSASETAAMAAAGKARVRAEFSRTTMAARLQDEMTAMRVGRRRPFTEWRDILLVLGVGGVFLAAFVATLTKATLTKGRPPPIVRRVPVPTASASVES